MNEIELVGHLSDDELVLLLERCVRDEREVSARLLVHLGEVDTRGLFRGAGFGSMFDYAVRALHMSEAEAALRIRAARFVRKFPTALAMVAHGELHLTALCLLSPVLTDQNIELLGLARRKSKAEVQLLIAEHFPRPDVRAEVRKLPEPRQPVLALASAMNGGAHVAAEPLLAGIGRGGAQQFPDSVVLRTSSPVRPDATSAPTQLDETACTERDRAQRGSAQQFPDSVVMRTNSPVHADVASASTQRERGERPAHHAHGPWQRRTMNVQVPLSESRYKIQFTASKGLNEKLEQAKELLRREVPSGDLESVFERALDLLIADRKKKMFGLTQRPRSKSRGGSGSECQASQQSQPEHDADRAEDHGTNAHDVGRVVARGEERPADAESVSEEKLANESANHPSRDACSVARKARGTRPRSRYLPRGLRRDVYIRDDGQCRFVGAKGNRCRARAFLEFHHVIPFELGGESTPGNIELRCRAHNAFEAERDFGRSLIRQKIECRRAAVNLTRA